MVAALAFAGLAASSASALSISPSNTEASVFGKAGLTFQAAGGSTWECKSADGNYRASEGSIKNLRFSNCGSLVFGFKTNCTSSGQPTGTIAVSNLTATLVYLDAAKTKFGYKLTPVGGSLAEFTCGGGLPNKWTGSVLGQITSPGLNVATKTANLQFTASGTTQTYQQVEGAGTAYHLWQSQGGGAQTELALVTNLELVSPNVFSYLP